MLTTNPTPLLFPYITSLKTNILYITFKKIFLKLPLQSYLGKGLVSHWALLPSIHPHRFVAHFWSRLQAWGSTHLRGGLHTRTPPPPQLQRKEHTSVRVKLMLWSSICDMLSETTKQLYLTTIHNNTTKAFSHQIQNDKTKQMKTIMVYLTKKLSICTWKYFSLQKVGPAEKVWEPPMMLFLIFCDLKKNISFFYI